MAKVTDYWTELSIIIFMEVYELNQLVTRAKQIIAILLKSLFRVIEVLPESPKRLNFKVNINNFRAELTRLTMKIC